MPFEMNGDLWRIVKVNPNSPYLFDRLGRHTLATTDPTTMCIYISNELEGAMLKRVLLHELGHCALFSFNLLKDIHMLVNKNNWIYAEEMVCNLFANYSELIFSIADGLLAYI